MKLSLCIPMYNESGIAREAVETYTSALDSIIGEDYEIVFCDDGSADDCADIVRSVGHPNVRVVGYEINRGKGCAVRTAVMSAVGDVILYTDCDNAYGTDKIAEAVAHFDDHPETDVLIGSRNADKSGYEGYTLLRKLASKTYILILKVVAGLRYSDSQCGFKALRRDAAHDIFSRCKTDRFAFDIEVLLYADKLGYRVSELPVKIINHRESESKVHIVKDTMRMLRDLKKIKKNMK